jgi:hypothetical protein
MFLMGCGTLPKKGDCFYLTTYDINTTYGGLLDAPTIQVYSYSKNKKDIFFRQLDRDNKYVKPIDMSKTSGLNGRTGLVWMKTKDFLRVHKQQSTFGFTQQGRSYSFKDGKEVIDTTCNAL